jgi:hypothetical protein
MKYFVRKYNVGSDEHADQLFQLEGMLKSMNLFIDSPFLLSDLEAVVRALKESVRVMGININVNDGLQHTIANSSQAEFQERMIAPH